MISVCNKQKLETILDQFMYSAELRRILAKAGIPESEPVKLSIKCGDMDVITDYEIPTTSPQFPFAPIETDFEQEMKILLDRAEDSHGFLSKLPPSDKLSGGTTKTFFQLVFKSSSRTIEFGRTCCGTYPCRDCKSCLSTNVKPTKWLTWQGFQDVVSRYTQGARSIIKIPFVQSFRDL